MDMLVVRTVEYLGASFCVYILLDNNPAQFPTAIYKPLVVARALRLGMLETSQAEPIGV
jgi:hypothetical protein